MAFEHNLTGDERVINEGVELVVRYLELYATPIGQTAGPARGAVPEP